MSQPFNQVPGKLDINTVVGDDFALLLEFKDGDGDPIDLTGYTFEGRILLDNSPYNRFEPFTITNTNLALGRITISLSDVQTNRLGPLSARKWYITWTAGADIRTVISGSFTLNPRWGVTNYSPTTETIEVTLQEDTVIVQVQGGVSGAVLWGDIQGDIEDQTDLIEYLEQNYAQIGQVLDFATYGIFTPEQFGANGDLRTVYDVSITNGSPLLVSATANFQSSDVGKTVVLHYSYAQNDYTIATILSVGSATQATMSVNATDTASNKQLEIGTDNTNAIQAAIDAVIEARGGVVQFQRKPYMVAGPLQYPVEDDPQSEYNSVLVINNDLTDDPTKPLVTITLLGQGAAPVGFNDYGSTARPPTTNTVIYCPTKGSNFNPSIISASHTIFNGSGSVAMFFENITFRVPTSSSIHAINAYYSGSFQVTQCSFDTAYSGINIDIVPTGGMAAIVAGVWGNNAWQVITNVWIIGYGVGVKGYEHCSMSEVNIQLCETGLFIGTGSGVFITKSMIQGCVNCISIDPDEGAPNLHAHALELECRPTGPFACQHYLDDPNKLLEGYIFGTITQGFSELHHLDVDFSSHKLSILISGDSNVGLNKFARVKSLNNVDYPSMAFGDEAADGALPYTSEGLKIGSSTQPVSIALTKGGGTGGLITYFPGPGNGAFWIGGYVAGNMSSAGASVFISPAGGRTICGGSVDDGVTALQVAGAITSTNFTGNASGPNQYYRRNAANNGWEFGNKTDYLNTTPTTGQTVSFNDNPVDQLMRINPATDLADLTVDIPSNASSINTQKVIFMCTKNIADLILTGATTIFNAPVSMNAGDCFQFYKSASDEWTRVIT